MLLGYPSFVPRLPPEPTLDWSPDGTPRAAAGALAVIREILSQTEPALELPVALARTRSRSGVAKNFDAASAIGRLALADALSCVALALRPEAKVLLAPAMNGKMWLHPATQENVRVLRERGCEFIGPEAGALACGYEGVGRLWPVEAIATRALALLNGSPPPDSPSSTSP